MDMAVTEFHPDEAAPHRPYHHGDLKNAIVATARAMLERQRGANLSFRAVAREANVSHAAPYRHFSSQEAMLAEVALGGFLELRDALSAAQNLLEPSTRLSALSRIYLTYIAEHPALARLMFESQILARTKYPALRTAASAIGEEIGIVLGDSSFGLSVWAALHGIAMLMLENVIDLGHAPADIDTQIAHAETMLQHLIPKV